MSLARSRYFMHNHRWKLLAGILSLVYHCHQILIGMDWYLPSGFLNKKKRTKLISLHISSTGYETIIHFLWGIFGIYSFHLNWLYYFIAVVKKKIWCSKKPRSGMWERWEFTRLSYQFWENPHGNHSLNGGKSRNWP